MADAREFRAVAVVVEGGQVGGDVFPAAVVVYGARGIEGFGCVVEGADVVLFGGGGF